MNSLVGPASGRLWSEPLEVAVGGMPRDELVEHLRVQGVSLNAHAETLLAGPAFDQRAGEVMHFVDRTVAELGLPAGGTLRDVFDAAAVVGLELCPVDAAPYLRLAWTLQANSTDSVLSMGRSPQGAMKVASAPLSDDAEYPKGFYLRVVDRVPWLRGYRCDDEYRFAADDRFAFRWGGTPL